MSFVLDSISSTAVKVVFTVVLVLVTCFLEGFKILFHVLAQVLLRVFPLRETVALSPSEPLSTITHIVLAKVTSVDIGLSPKRLINLILHDRFGSRHPVSGADSPLQFTPIQMCAKK